MIDMTNKGNMNGVTRCVSVLVDAFSENPSYNVTWIRFTHAITNNIQIRERGKFRHILVPLPQDIKLFLANDNIRYAYWNRAFNILSSYLADFPILHIHTLNLSEFAIIVKQHVPCMIVTHLHCIPWKGLYNVDVNLFNHLYEQYYIKKEYKLANFIRHKYEYMAYTQSDCLICVTECARNFIYNVCPYHTKNIQVIYNGIQDWAPHKTYRKTTKNIKCLFVGDSHPSKGIDYVLEAIQGVLVRHPVSLKIVGAFAPSKIKEIHRSFPFLDIHFVGQVDIARLQQIYAESDIGLIGSIQEQCSYVAIEMMMAGIPIISTSIDGLDELFIQGFNGIKIPVTFNPRCGISVDIPQMANELDRLVEHPEERKKLGENARKHYLKFYTHVQMTQQVDSVYQTLLLK